MNIYHRIYKLHQRKIPAQQIAATTHMPLKSVREIIKKLETKDKNEVVLSKPIFELDPYLDYHVTKTQKYTIIDFSGFLTEQFMSTQKEAIAEVRQQLGTTLALQMLEVVEVDNKSLEYIISIGMELEKVAKSLVILSPSEVVEKKIEELKLEEHIRVFGTLGTFEEHANSLSHGK